MRLGCFKVVALVPQIVSSVARRAARCCSGCPRRAPAAFLHSQRRFGTLRDQTTLLLSDRAVEAQHKIAVGDVSEECDRPRRQTGGPTGLPFARPKFQTQRAIRIKVVSLTGVNEHVICVRLLGEVRGQATHFEHCSLCRSPTTMSQ